MGKDIKLKSNELSQQLNMVVGDVNTSNLTREKKQDLKARIGRVCENLQKKPDDPIVLEGADDILACARAIVELDRIASTDPVSGLPNRSMFDRDLSITINRIQRDTGGKVRFAILFADADFFKKFNDEISHSAGDDAIRQIGDTLTSTARTDESVFHWGGDEFALILRDVTAKSDEEAQHNFGLALGRFQDSFRENIFEYGKERRPLTMSMGIHMITQDDFSPGDNAKTISEKIQDIADLAAYKDKQTKNERQKHVWDIINGVNQPGEKFEHP